MARSRAVVGWLIAPGPHPSSRTTTERSPTYIRVFIEWIWRSAMDEAAEVPGPTLEQVPEEGLEPHGLSPAGS